MPARSHHWRTESSQQPGPPPEGIPPQRTPAPLRFALKALVLPFMLLDLAVQKIIQTLSPPPYKITGGCKQRGHCCHYILMQWPPILDKWPWFRAFWLWWHTDIHGFYSRGFDAEGPNGDVVKVMSCRYLQKDGRCGQYPLRPAICRQWPRIEFTSRPHLLKGCGYQILPRNPPPSDDNTISK